MPWFEGSIPDAVASAKSKSAIFVVFVEGQDEASRKTRDILHSTEIGAKLQSEDFVVIRINSDGESFRQFAQIYHLVPVPSVFFIGNNGVPLEVVAGEVPHSDMIRRINGVLAKAGKDTSFASTSLISAESSHGAGVAENEVLPAAPAQVVPAVDSNASVVTVIETASKDAAEEEAGVSASTDAAQPAHDEETPEAGLEEPQTVSQATVEQRVERARQLLEQKKAQKGEEDERENRNRELQRRRVGQEVQKLRRMQQEQEAAQLAEQIKRERSEEQAARQRVLQQIQQDKAERAARMSQAREEEAHRVEEDRRRAEQVAAARAAEGARIQFRLPDGSTHTHVFTAQTRLSEVRLYAASNLQLPFRDFGMSMTFPRREFTTEDDDKSVIELQLSPTAVILILPANRGEVVSQPGYLSVASQLLWTLVAPIISVFGYLRRLLGWDAGNRRPSRSTSAARGSTAAGRRSPTPAAGVPPVASKTGAEADGSNGSGVRRRTGGPGADIRRQGNIHRLANRQDSSDDENNTWNGNSTQQM